MVLFKAASPIMLKISALALHSSQPFCIHHCRKWWSTDCKNKDPCCHFSIKPVKYLHNCSLKYISLLDFNCFLKQKSQRNQRKMLAYFFSKEVLIQMNAIFSNGFETKMLMNSSFILIFLPTNWISHAHHIFPHGCILNAV